MKRPVRTGPKRRRWRRRDWSGAGGIGQERRWGATVGNFKAEREARRAGLIGKITKHRGTDPFNLSDSVTYAMLMYNDQLTVLTRIGGAWVKVTDPSRERASPEREADPDSLANQREEEREEE
jgi:hypothetical protein